MTAEAAWTCNVMRPGPEGIILPRPQPLLCSGVNAVSNYFLSTRWGLQWPQPGYCDVYNPMGETDLSLNNPK